MSLFRDRYRVESSRLKNWDYAAAGWYFVTICTREREPILGEVVNGKMRLSVIGKTAHQCWKEIPEHFGHVQLDGHVVMPNHVHGILNIIDNHII